MFYINLYMQLALHQPQEQQNSPLQISNFYEDTIPSTYKGKQTDFHHIGTGETYQALHIMFTWSHEHGIAKMRVPLGTISRPSASSSIQFATWVTILSHPIHSNSLTFLIPLSTWVSISLHAVHDFNRYSLGYRVSEMWIPGVRRLWHHSSWNICWLLLYMFSFIYYYFFINQWELKTVYHMAVFFVCWMYILLIKLPV